MEIAHKAMMTGSVASTARKARGRTDDASHRQYRCKKTLHDRSLLCSAPLCARSNHPTGTDFIRIALIERSCVVRPMGCRLRTAITIINETSVSSHDRVWADEYAFELIELPTVTCAAMRPRSGSELGFLTGRRSRRDHGNSRRAAARPIKHLARACWESGTRSAAILCAARWR